MTEPTPEPGINICSSCRGLLPMVGTPAWDEQVEYDPDFVYEERCWKHKTCA